MGGISHPPPDNTAYGPSWATSMRSATKAALWNIINTLLVDNGVKVYRALLNQTLTAAPVATVLENTLGGTVVLARTTNGVYTLTLASAFTASKTQIFTGLSTLNAPDGTLFTLVKTKRTSANVVTIYTMEVDMGGPSSQFADELLADTEILIVVCP